MTYIIENLSDTQINQNVEWNSTTYDDGHREGVLYLSDGTGVFIADEC